MNSVATPRLEIVAPGTVRKDRFPLSIRRGSIVLKIYARRGVGGRAIGPYTIAWHEPEQAGRCRAVRAALVDAKNFGDEKATELANGETWRAQFGLMDYARFQRLLQIEREAGVSLEDLAAEGQASIAARSRAKFVTKTCPQIFVELLASKRAEKAGKRWIQDLDSRLGRFVKDFTGPMHLISTDDFRTWLARLNLSPRSYNNYRAAILAMVTFAKDQDRKYLPKDWCELEAIKPKKITKGVEELYTPEEMRSMLFTAEKHYPQHLPVLAIMGFAGCRHSELRDDDAWLDWADVHLKTSKIHIREHVAKSNTGRRYVPMPANLVAWLEPYAKLRGPVSPAKYLGNALVKIAAKAGIEWKRNALRNSFISYRCAITKNVAQVASEAGNSPGEIHKSYRQEIPEEEAQRWFEIVPTKSDVLPLFAHARLS